MAKQRPKNTGKVSDQKDIVKKETSLHYKFILCAVFALLGVIMLLGAAGSGGVVGYFLYQRVAVGLFGYLGLLIPLGLIYSALVLLSPKKFLPGVLDFIMAALLIVSSAGVLQLLDPSLELGGIVGKGFGTIIGQLFGHVGGIITLCVVIFGSILVLFGLSGSFWEWLVSLFHSDEQDIYATLSDDPETTFVPEASPAVETKKPSDAFEASLKETAAQAEKKAPVVPEKNEDVFSIDPVSFSGDYVLPPLSLLSRSAGKPSVGDIRAQGNIIKQTLANFGIDVEMDEVSVGPTVTRYALKPAQGIKLTRIVALKQDLSLSLAAYPLRIEAPIPGKSLVGIEIPNITKSSVGLGTLLEDDQFQSSTQRLLVALGKGVTGKSYFSDISKMPHLLIAGTTGAGKSVTVHNLIMSLLYRNTPEELRFIFVDPKRVELTLYNDIPHLLTPVIKEPKKAILALKWAAKEMERRYDLLEKSHSRDIKSYHENIVYPFYKANPKATGEDSPDKMPYIVIVIDELADIMQAYPRELEAAIVRLAQMSRATGIHLVLSTQRPSVNVITGLIKANIPSRLALQVASQIDSRTILDAPGAESLLGKGDMLFQGADMSKPERMQAAWLPEDEIKKVVAFIKKRNPALNDHIVMSEALDDTNAIVGTGFGDDESDDPLYEDAKRAVVEAGKASTSYLQRKLKVGYSRAARLIDLLEEKGVVGPADGAKPREVISGSAKPDTSVDNLDEGLGDEMF